MSKRYSAISFSELAREVERYNPLHPLYAAKRRHLSRLLTGEVSVIAATDYVCALSVSGSSSPSTTNARSRASNVLRHAASSRGEILDKTFL
jgi:pyruvate dehydrogenase complex dehydrogenase (E1) component